MHGHLLVSISSIFSDNVFYEKLSKRQGLAQVRRQMESNPDAMIERSLLDGDHVTTGERLMRGAADPHDVLEVLGRRGVEPIRRRQLPGRAHRTRRAARAYVCESH